MSAAEAFDSGAPEGAVDCLIIGAGPAGLTAAIYAARFRLKIQVIDAGASRAALIPCTRNHAGFPEGVSGHELLARMAAQAAKYGASIEHGAVTRLATGEGGFLAETTIGDIRARTVLLATGVTNRRPAMPEDVHRAAVAAGRLRYCPVCDGFEVIGQDVAVIGTAERGLKEAKFLRSYTDKVTLVAPAGPHEFGADERTALAEANIAVVDGPADGFELTDQRFSFSCALGRRSFDAVYPALGSDVHSDLAKTLGANLTSEDCIKVDSHQRTSVAGLYAAGDVVIGLDQISHAMGEAGVAATTIRNDLAAQRPLYC